MILFVDQSGQPGGAELCLGDLAAHALGRSRVLLFSHGRFEEMLRERGVSVSVLETPRRLAAVGKEAGMADYLSALPEMAGFLRALNWKKATITLKKTDVSPLGRSLTILGMAALSSVSYSRL